MGKGEIQSHIGSGQYNVKLVYAYRARITAKLASLQKEIDAITVKIAAETDQAKLAILKLQKASMQRRYDYYLNGMPEDPTVEAWCADLTEDLSGNVGTIEIPGEPVQIIIRPGYDSRATYSQSRDGQLMPAIAGEPNQVLFNWMLLPGWQRHMPIYRVGTIESIDYSANTATVCLDPAFSSQQYLPAVDGIDDGGCSAANPFDSQIADFCSRNPGHPLCTNTEAGDPINLSDAQLAQLQFVNQTVNNEFGRASDPSGYRLGDSWDLLDGDASGDCEDFALTKMARLVDTYGWNARDLKIITGYVPHLGEYHAMVAVRTSNRGLVILDVNNDAVLQNSKTPYRLHRIALTKDEWTSISRKLEAVPVEYMNCNAYVFYAGDEVVVEFANQDYDEPKVIGFAEEPRPCSGNQLFLTLGTGYDSMGWFSVFKIDTETWRLTAQIYDKGVVEQCGAVVNGLGYMAGGADFWASLSVALKKAYRINGLSETVSTLADMPAEKMDGCGGATSNKFYAAGGRNNPDGSGFLDSNYEYDTVAFSWATRKTLITKRRVVYGMTLGGKPIYAGGHTGVYVGFHSDYEGTDNVEQYDPTTDTFASLQEMDSRTWADAQASDGVEYGYSFQGYLGAPPTTPTRNARRYSLTGDAWASINQVPATSQIENSFPAGYSGVASKIYIRRRSAGDEAHLNEYDPVGDTYRELELSPGAQNDIASASGYIWSPAWVL